MCWIWWTIALCASVSECIVYPEYGGWKALRKPYRNRTKDNHSGNDDPQTPSDTRRSFMLVYPPKPELRAPPPPTASTSSEKPKQRQSNTIASQPTSHHQVQVQLLDGYALPPGSFEISNYQSLGNNNGLPGELRVSPVFIGDVPEIRLILPGDVHRQLKELDSNSHHKTPSSNQQRMPSGPFIKANSSSYGFLDNRPNGGVSQTHQQHENSRGKVPGEYSPPDVAAIHSPLARTTGKPTVLLESSIYWPASNGVVQPENNYLNNPVQEFSSIPVTAERWVGKENNNSKRIYARHLTQNLYQSENMNSKTSHQRHYESSKGSATKNENFGYSYYNNNNNNKQFNGQPSNNNYTPDIDQESTKTKPKGYPSKQDCRKNKDSGKSAKPSDDKADSTTSASITTVADLGTSQQKADDIYQQLDEENMNFLFAPSAEQTTPDSPTTMNRKAALNERSVKSIIPQGTNLKVADIQDISLQLIDSTFGTCAPVVIGSGEKSFENIREAARVANADAVFDFLNVTEDEVHNMLTENGGRVLFLPSNEALQRIPSIISEPWRKRPEGFFKNAMVIQDPSQDDGSQSLRISQLKNGNHRLNSVSGILFVDSKTDDEAVTVNGRRLVRGDIMVRDSQVLLHVVDNLLCPAADRDIIETVRSCGKYDGFLTLAHVTGLMDDLQTDGPFTVFLPSNNALSRIPSDELEILKENVTALKDFLEYHVVEGSYFSGNLMDGQYLQTLRQSTRLPLKVGIRMDGCQRRLIEVNHSPTLKTDIPTKNGVIHIVDWILRPSDLEWCQDVLLP